MVLSSQVVISRIAASSWESRSASLQSPILRIMVSCSKGSKPVCTTGLWPMIHAGSKNSHLSCGPYALHRLHPTKKHCFFSYMDMRPCSLQSCGTTVHEFKNTLTRNRKKDEATMLTYLKNIVNELPFEQPHTSRPYADIMKNEYKPAHLPSTIMSSEEFRIKQGAISSTEMGRTVHGGSSPAARCLQDCRWQGLRVIKFLEH